MNTQETTAGTLLKPVALLGFKDEAELCRYILKWTRISGELKGMLSAVSFWDVPDELKDKIAKHLETVEFPSLPESPA